jgi:hypothetical protein
MKLKSLLSLYLIAALGLAVVSCEDEDGINDYAPERPVGGYTSSNQIAPADLAAHWTFSNTLSDSVGALAGTSTGTTFVSGVKGLALQGSDGKFVSYANPGALATLQSFTVALWINTRKHADGAQAVFMLPRTSDFWGNMFLMIESNTSNNDSMFVKFNFDGQWAEMGGNLKMPNMYGGWKHLAFTYDAGSSKFAAFQNGKKLNLPATMTDRKAGTNPLGSLSFTDVSKFIIGGFQQHLGAPWSAPDGWMKTYTGSLDEFRVYKKALSESDINSLYKLELLGR